MADAAVSFLLENLQELIAREVEQLSNVKDIVGWIQTEFQLMVAHQESIDSQHHLSDDEENWVERTRSVIRRAEDLIETYAKTASRRKMVPIYEKLIYWIEEVKLVKELDRLKDEIIKLRQAWRSVDFAVNSSSSSLKSTHRDSAAIAKLDSAIQVQFRVPLVGAMKWVRDELDPLHHFLQQLSSSTAKNDVLLLGERQKIWIQELRDIFHFVDESLDIRAVKLSILDQFKLTDVVTEIQHKILQLYRVYYAYGFGKIIVNNGRSSSIFPRIRMTTPIPDVSIRASETDPNMTAYLMFLLPCIDHHPFDNRAMGMTYSSWLTPRGPAEMLRVDLKLMNALLEDTRSMTELLDERAKVWLKQVQDTCVDLEDRIGHSNDGGKCSSSGIIGMTGKQRQIAEDIRDIAARKMIYGIGSALGEYQPFRLPFNQILDDRVVFRGTSTFDLIRQVKSVEKELQLMQASLKDANRMEKLDARLKVWVEEMQFAAREASAVMEYIDENPFPRYEAARRINKIYNHIRIMSRWKHTYAIGDIKSRRHAGIFSHSIEGTGQYPNEAIQDKLELIRREIKLMRALDNDTIKIDELDGPSKAWVEEMSNIAEDAESLISSDDRIGFAIHLNGLLDWIRQYSKMKRPSDHFGRVQDKISQLSEIRTSYGIELTQRLPPHIVRQIKEMLLMDHGQHCIIPILGMSHTHKEALQDLINHDNAIMHYFNWHAWVHIPQDFSGEAILEYMAMRIMEQGKAQFHEEELKSLSEVPTPVMLMQLMRTRCLIVLDEIHDVQVWVFLNRELQQISTGSRIILISNEHTYSRLCSTPNGIVEAGKPVILGQLPAEGRDVMLPGMDDASNIDPLNVPSYLRRCLYYFVLFPAYLEVPARRLIVMWVAEGLVYSRKNEKIEHVAEGYLHELIDRGMVCVTKTKLNGKVIACRLNPGMRDTWLKLAREAKFFQDEKGIISRLVDHHGSTDSASFIQIHGNSSSSASIQNYRDVISFLSFDTQEGSKPGEDIGAFLRKCILAGCFRSLRTLDLERVFRPKLPEELSKLTRVRYLGLRWTYLEYLPENVSNLLNLQVLDVKHTYISTLPRSIWKMQYLRHLYLSETYRTKFDGRPSGVSLKDLQTLWGAFIDENTSVKGGLDTLHNICKLGLSCKSSSSETSLMSEQLKVVAKWISNLEFLESLRLKSRDEHGKASDLYLETLESNEKLSTVYLLGKLQPSVVETFPNNLIEITLSGSELKYDPMKYLEKLPELLILRLLSRSVVHEKLHCSKEGFLKLKVLNIWKLENLKEWEVEEGALPCLEDLEIRSCENLKMIPDALKHVKTLKELCLTSIPKGFVDKSKEEQPELWSKLEHVIKVVEEQVSTVAQEK